MKRITLSILASFTLFALFYLIGSFIEVSFNIANWNEATRGFIGFCGGLMSLIIGAGIYSFLED